MPPTLDSMVTSSKSDTCLEERKDKKVRFADSMGLELVSVCFIPETPRSSKTSTRKKLAENTERVRLLNFSPPVSRSDFGERLSTQNVCLEDIVFREYSAIGTIKVRNLAFEKRVVVRYSTNGWTSFQDIEAKFVQQDSTSSWADRFSFEIAIPGALESDCKVEFAIYFEVLGLTFWDNNNGDNYRVMYYGQESSRWRSRNLFRAADFYHSRYTGLSL